MYDCLSIVNAFRRLETHVIQTVHCTILSISVGVTFCTLQSSLEICSNYYCTALFFCCRVENNTVHFRVRHNDAPIRGAINSIAAMLSTSYRAIVLFFIVLGGV